VTIDEKITEHFALLYSSLDEFLDTYNSNLDYHSKNYKDLFNEIIFADLCKKIPSLYSQYEKCSQFYQEILQKGIYSSTIKYANSLRQLHTDFINSKRNPKNQANILGSDIIKTSDSLESYYFSESINFLANILHSDINKSYFIKSVSCIVDLIKKKSKI